MNSESSNPNEAKFAMVRQGKKLMWEKKYQQASAVFTQAVDSYPDYAEAYVGRAYSNSVLDVKGDAVIADFRNAEEAYRRRGQPDRANNIAKLIKQYQREKLGIQ